MPYGADLSRDRAQRGRAQSGGPSGGNQGQLPASPMSAFVGKSPKQVAAESVPKAAHDLGLPFGSLSLQENIDAFNESKLAIDRGYVAPHAGMGLPENVFGPSGTLGGFPEKSTSDSIQAGATPVGPGNLTDPTFTAFDSPKRPGLRWAGDPQAHKTGLGAFDAPDYRTQNVEVSGVQPDAPTTAVKPKGFLDNIGDFFGNPVEGITDAVESFADDPLMGMINSSMTIQGMQAAVKALSHISGMDDSTPTSAAANFTSIGSKTPNGFDGRQDTFGIYGDPHNLNAEQPFSGLPREGPGGRELPSAPLGADIGLAPPVAPQGPSDAQLTDFLQQGFKSQLGSIFPGNAFELDQFLIDEIVNERLGSAQEQVALAGGAGNLNTAGSSIANQFLQQQLEAAGQSVSDIGGGVISGFQSDINAIRDRGLADIGNFQFGDPFFDPSPFAAEREALIGERTPTLGPNIRTALGGDPLFDVSEALRLGGGGQGLVPGPSSQSTQALLDVLAAGATPITRTIPSSGSGIF